MPDEDKAKLDEFFQVLESYIEQSNLENPHLGPHAKDLDSITLQEFAEKHFETAHAKLIVAQLGPAWLGVEPAEMSALYLIDYCKSGTGVKNMSSDLKNGGQYLRNRQGE
jgi:monoamine oxidase